MSHHRGGVAAHEVAVADLDHHIGQLVGVVLGVQIRSADAAGPHVEHQLALAGARIGQVDNRESSVFATDGFHELGFWPTQCQLRVNNSSSSALM